MKTQHNIRWAAILRSLLGLWASPLTLAAFGEELRLPIPQLVGTWSVVATNVGSNRCCKVTFPAGGKAGFYRIRYSNE